MSNNMAKIADARKTVEQLKLEVNIERMMVSHRMMEMQSRVKKKVSMNNSFFLAVLVSIIVYGFK